MRTGITTFAVRTSNGYTPLIVFLGNSGDDSELLFGHSAKR